MFLIWITKSTIILSAVALSAVLVACQPNLDITFENRSSQDLFVDVNGQGSEKVKADDAETFSILTGSDSKLFEITAKTEDGLIVYQEELTKKQLDATDRRILLDEPLQPQPGTTPTR